MKPARYLGEIVLLYHGEMTLFVAADILLCLVFGTTGLFGTYLPMFPMFYMLIHAVLCAFFTSFYAPQFLAFGLTRRQIARAYGLGLAASTVVGLALSGAAHLAVGAVFPAERELLEHMFTLFGHVGPTSVLPFVCAGALCGWMGTFTLSGWRRGLAYFAVILVAFLVCFVGPMLGNTLYMAEEDLPPQLAMFALLASQGGSALCALIALPLTLRGLRRLTY